ncbi:MAG: T9SS type A sorting domain-containing protein, partial [Calditrichota bacterium]
HLFIADSNDTLRVFNINSPDDPKPVGYYEGPRQVAFAEVNNNILFLARPYVVQLLDVHDPMTPLEISSYSTGVPFALTALGVHEETLYLGFSNGDIRVLDISDPTQPQERGRYRDFGSEPVGFAFDNDLIYAAYLDRGLAIFQKGFGPVPWANIPSLDETKGVAVNGHLVYMADGDAGLRIFEVKSPEQIREAASFKTGNTASRLAISGDRVFMGDELAGIYILQTDFTLQSNIASKSAPDKIFELQPAYPNPFNPSTTVRFELSAAQRIDIVVYNVLGQEVRSIAAGTFESGLHQLRWDGRDNFGNSLGSGMYFLRIQSSHQVQTQRLMLVK